MDFTVDLEDRRAPLITKEFKTETQEEFGEGIKQLVKNLKPNEVFEGHTNCVSCLRVFGKYLASSSWDKSIRIWDLDTKRQEAVLKGHTDTVNCIAIYGNYLISGSKDTTIRLWNLESWEEEVLLEGHTGSVLCLEILGSYLASGSADKTVRIWNLETKSEEMILEGHNGGVRSFALLGNHLASGSEDETIRIWDIENREEQAVIQTSGWINSLLVTGNYLISGSSDSTVRLWNAQTRTELAKLEGHTSTVFCLGLVGKYLASGSRDGSIRLWNLETEETEGIIEGHVGTVFCLESLGKCLISGSSDKTIRLWSLETDTEEILIYSHTDKICSLALVGKYLAWGSADSSIRLWNTETGVDEGVLEGHTDCVWCLIEGKGFLVSGSWDKTIRIWNLESNTEEAVLRGHKDWVNCLTVMGKYLVSGSRDATIRLWDFESGLEEAVLKGHIDSVSCLTVKGNYLVSGSKDNTVRLWNIQTGKEEARLEGHTNWVRDLVVIEDYLVSASRDNTIRLWNLNSLEEEVVIKGHRNGIRCLAVFENYIISGGWDNAINIWNIETKEKESFLECHTNWVNSLVPVGNYLASCCDDGKIKLTKLVYDYRSSPGPIHGIHLFKKLTESNACQYDKSINSLAIMPQKINLLHILAYQGRDKLLEEALEQGCCFLESSSGKTPLTFALENNNKRCTEVILKYVRDLEDTHRQRVIVSRISKDLESIIETDSSHLSFICEALTCSSIKSMEINKLPAYINNENDIVNYPKTSQEIKETKINRTNFRFNFMGGSNDSLGLLKALQETGRSECLRSDFVQALTGYKWNKFMWAFWTLSLLNLLSIVFISGITFSSNTVTRQTLAGLFLSVNSILAVFELFQVVALRKQYFKLSRNYIDILRLTLGYVWGVVALSSDFENLNSTNILTIIVSILFWLEGIDAFKVFDSTRYYIWLIQEVIKDTFAFFLVLIYFVVAYCGVIGTTVNSDIWETFKVSYRLLLGDFDVGDFNEVQWVVFVLGSLLNLIVMLNLLISIISESFDKITFEAKESDTRIRLELILEVENCLFWNRNAEQPEYLYFIQEYSGEEEDTEWESRVRKVYNDSQVIKNKIAGNSREIQEVRQEVQEMKTKLQSEFQGMKEDMQKKMENIQVKLEAILNHYQ